MIPIVTPSFHVLNRTKQPKSDLQSYCLISHIEEISIIFDFQNYIDWVRNMLLSLFVFSYIHTYTLRTTLSFFQLETISLLNYNYNNKLLGLPPFKTIIRITEEEILKGIRI